MSGLFTKSAIPLTKAGPSMFNTSIKSPDFSLSNDET